MAHPFELPLLFLLLLPRDAIHAINLWPSPFFTSITQPPLPLSLPLLHPTHCRPRPKLTRGLHKRSVVKLPISEIHTELKNIQYTYVKTDDSRFSSLSVANADWSSTSSHSLHRSRCNPRGKRKTTVAVMVTHSRWQPIQRPIFF